MTSIFNTSRGYPRMHALCKFGNSSSNLWRVIVRTRKYLRMDWQTDGRTTTIPLHPKGQRVKMDMDGFNTRHQRMHVPAWGLIRGNGKTEMATEGQNLANVAQKRINSEHTPNISVDTKFELDCGNTFSDNGRKPILIILCPPEGQKLANVEANPGWMDWCTPFWCPCQTSSMGTTSSVGTIKIHIYWYGYQYSHILLK